jgi:hypothetical protein
MQAMQKLKHDNKLKPAKTHAIVRKIKTKQTKDTPEGYFLVRETFEEPLMRFSNVAGSGSLFF